MLLLSGMMSKLKLINFPNLGLVQYSHDQSYHQAVQTCDHIMKLASTGHKIPLVSFNNERSLLLSLKSTATDYYSVTSQGPG